MRKVNLKKLVGKTNNKNKQKKSENSEKKKTKITFQVEKRKAVMGEGKVPSM